MKLLFQVEGEIISTIHDAEMPRFSTIKSTVEEEKRNAPSKKGRGRPKGSKNLKPSQRKARGLRRKRQKTNSETSSENSEDSGMDLEEDEENLNSEPSDFEDFEEDDQEDDEDEEEVSIRGLDSAKEIIGQRQ